MNVVHTQADGMATIRVELAGADPRRDLDIRVRNGVLHVSARPPAASGRTGGLSHSVRLRPGARARDVTARVHGSVLEIRAPVAGATVVSSHAADAGPAR